MIVGFTGTRRGMSVMQVSRFGQLIRDLDVTEFHHGDCVGADFEAAEIIVHQFLDIKIVIHPPDLTQFRAFMPLRPGDERRTLRPYIERNHVIVRGCQHLIVAPLTNEQVVRSGTWATYRYAEARGITTTILRR